jgi:hypothetical protein
VAFGGYGLSDGPDRLSLSAQSDHFPNGCRHRLVKLSSDRARNFWGPPEAASIE